MFGDHANPITLFFPTARNHCKPNKYSPSAPEVVELEDDEDNKSENDGDNEDEVEDESSKRDEFVFFPGLQKCHTK